MLTFHVIPLFLVIASEAWNLKVCACAMILDSSLRSATFRMTECQHYLVNLSDDACTWFLVYVLGWLNLDVRERVGAVVHFDQGLLGDHDVSTLVACIEQGNNGVFEFRLIDEVPVEARIRLDSSFVVHSHILSPTQHPSQGLLVSMPEWSPSAAGWVLARVIDAAHTLGSNPSKYAVRISRVSA